jgi:hypothetical protein
MLLLCKNMVAYCRKPIMEYKRLDTEEKAMTEKKLSDAEVMEAFKTCCFEGSEQIQSKICDTCPYFKYDDCTERLVNDAFNIFNRQQAEIEAWKHYYNECLTDLKNTHAENERLKEEVSKTRRKALLEASSKFAGHNDYHGDTILCKLICMAEGKEVKSARPLDKAKIKAEAYKEFAEEYKDQIKNYTGIFTDDGFYVSLQAVLSAVDFIKEKLVGEDNG